MIRTVEDPYCKLRLAGKDPSEKMISQLVSSFFMGCNKTKELICKLLQCAISAQKLTQFI